MPSRQVLSAFAPLLVVIVWVAAGQWAAASDEAHAWLVLIAVLGAAGSLPLPAPRKPAFNDLTRMKWFGWAAVVGLIAIS